MPILTKMLRAVSLLFCMMWLTACGGGSDSDSSEPAERGALLGSEVIGEYSSSNLRIVTFSLLSGRSYDVEIVKLSYQTALEGGDLVKASGIITLPAGKTGPSRC